MSLVFVVNYWRQDEHLAKRLVEQLDQHYSEASRILLPDVPRLKDKQTGEWTQRYLEWGLASGADVIIKLDPDTCIWRRAELPKADWFGTLSNSGQFIRGGACGFSRRAAGRLVASKILLRPSAHFYHRYSEFRWPHENSSEIPLSCQDRIMGDAIAEMGIPPTVWTEVRILGNDNRVPDVEDFAMTHPHPI